MQSQSNWCCGSLSPYLSLATQTQNKVFGSADLEPQVIVECVLLLSFLSVLFFPQNSNNVKCAYVIGRCLCKIKLSEDALTWTARIVCDSEMCSDVPSN